MATKKTNTQEQSSMVAVAQNAAGSEVGRDLKNSVLVLSVLANLVVFTTWLVVQVTSQYNQQLANFLFQ